MPKNVIFRIVQFLVIELRSFTFFNILHVFIKSKDLDEKLQVFLIIEVTQKILL